MYYTYLSYNEYYLHKMKINAANAAINKIVTTAKNIIRYSIGISFFVVAVNECFKLHYQK